MMILMGDMPILAIYYCSLDSKILWLGQIPVEQAKCKSRISKWHLDSADADIIQAFVELENYVIPLTPLGDDAAKG